MEMTIMLTDGGPHPPEKMAANTLSGVIDLVATSPDALLREEREFKAKATVVLTRHHGLAQNHERTGIATEGTDRLATNIDTSAHVPDAVDDLIALAKGTSFAAHFAKPETRAYLEQLLHEHFHRSMWEERSWHADTNSDHPLSKLFRAVDTHGHALLPLSDEDLDEHGGREVVSRMIVANHISAVRQGV